MHYQLNVPKFLDAHLSLHVNNRAVQFPAARKVNRKALVSAVLSLDFGWDILVFSIEIQSVLLIFLLFLLLIHLSMSTLMHLNLLSSL